MVEIRQLEQLLHSWQHSRLRELAGVSLAAQRTATAQPATQLIALALGREKIRSFRKGYI